MILFYSELFQQIGFGSSKVLNVQDKLKSHTIVGKVEFTFNDNQKFLSEGVLNNCEDDDFTILNLTTPNKKNIFKKIFSDQIVKVKIILSAPFSKNNDTIVIEENYDFRNEYKDLGSDMKDVYDYVLKELSK